MCVCVSVCVCVCVCVRACIHAACVCMNLYLHNCVLKSIIKIKAVILYRLSTYILCLYTLMCKE